MSAPALSPIPSLTPRQQAAHDRALSKSTQEAQRGNLPILIRNGQYTVRLSVHSRTTAGTVYLLDYDKHSGTATCDCGATNCWHKTHACRAIEGEIGVLMTRPATPSISAADLSGRG